VSDDSNKPVESLFNDTNSQQSPPSVQPSAPAVQTAVSPAEAIPLPKTHPSYQEPALTLDELRKNVPARLKKVVTQAHADLLNKLSKDPNEAAIMRDNFLGYSNILKDGTYKLQDYVYAVKYCSYRLMGFNNRDSYVKTFPDRYDRFIQEGKSSKAISAFVTAYKRNKLVNAIMEQTIIPAWVLNQDMHQEALNVQADLMLNAKSEKVRSDAANSILTHLKKPEKHDIEISVGVVDTSGINELNDSMANIAKLYQEKLKKGEASTHDITQHKISHASHHVEDIEDAEVVED